MSVMVSVIIPTYNYGRFIKETLDSVMSQTFGDFEVIVINDGSTDNTLEVLSIVHDSRLKVITTDNGGIGAARNHGLDCAQGDYIAFLDADDIWMPRKLEMQLQIIQDDPEVNFVFTDAVRFDENRIFDRSILSYVPELRRAKKHPVLNGQAYVLDCDLFDFLVPIRMFATWPQTVLLKREPFKEYKFPVKTISEDYHYMARVYQHAKGAYIAEPLVKIRRHGSNSYSSALEMMEPKIAVLKDLLTKVETPQRQRIVRKQIGSVLNSLGYYHYWNGNIHDSIAAYTQSLCYPGWRINSGLHLAALPFFAVLNTFRKKRRTDSTNNTTFR